MYRNIAKGKCVPKILGLIPNGILAAWPSSIPLKEFAFLTTNVQLMTAVLYVESPYLHQVDRKAY
jgi:hypothetical protein